MITKIGATFESYWNSSDFEPYSEDQKQHLETALKAERLRGKSNRPFPFDIQPYPYQQEILDRLRAEREVRGYYKNLVVAATGTGKTVVSAFDYRSIAAEIRLTEAIDRKLLCPFQYFGVTDTVDLNSLRWVRGGYDKSELTKLYTMNRAVAERRANHIIQSLDKYVTDMGEVKGLGFCVSIEHAKFMAEHFNACGIPSIYLVGQSVDEERYTAKKRLISGEIRFIFVVDIYNEGVDIPEVNTVLFLRPTESLTIFLQQLGRGLRLAEGKECLTVLDFIGQANKKYNFEDKFAALLSNTTHSVQREIKDGFVNLPKGCYIQLERKAKEYILNDIRSSFGVKAGIVSHIAAFEEDTGKPLTLSNFLEYYHLDPRTVYSRACFARLCVLAGVRDNFNEDIETVFKNAFSRLCTIDSRRWITCLLELLPRLADIDFSKLCDIERTFLQMFYVTVWNKPAENLENDEVLQNLWMLADSPVILSELLELLRYNLNRIDLVDESLEVGFNFALDLHCTYSMRQIATAMGYFNYSALQGIGVKYFPEKKTDVFFITLNKAEKDYSPTTMYNDYSINEWLFHWQSQSTTADTSPTGQRYINHKATGNKILLFVREFKNDNFGTGSYNFLGLADYVKHDGSKPMNITWKLLRPIPAKYLKKTNKLVVG